MTFQVVFLFLLSFCCVHGDVNAVPIGYKQSERDLSLVSNSSGSIPFDLDVNNWIQVSAQPGWKQLRNTVESCYRMDPGPATDNYPEVLEKTVFDEEHRYFFIAGLEGAGHHMFEKLFEKCEKCTCVEEWETPDTEGFTFSSIRNNCKGLFGSTVTLEEVVSLVDKFKGTIESIKQQKKGSPVILNTLCAHKPGGFGELSYPNSGGECKSLQYPDARMLAELMEYARIDLRVIVLVRNSIDVLLSTTIHRNMGDRFKAIDRYKNITDHLLDKQLKRIDSRFVHCIDYDKFPEIPPSLEEFTQLGKHGFSMEEAAKQIFTSHNSDERKEHERKLYILTDEHQEYMRLVKAVNRLREFCGLEPEDYSRFQDTDSLIT